MQANTPRLVDEVADLKQRLADVESWVGMPAGGQKAVDAVIEMFIDSVHGTTNDEMEQTG
jgi:hypothetical protein